MIGSVCISVNVSVETESLPQQTVLPPKPGGFCPRVIRAVDIVLIALEQLGNPVEELELIKENEHFPFPAALHMFERVTSDAYHAS
jgi:hypothetical protein